MEKNNENNKQPEPIAETALAVQQVPWWKTALKVGSYILSVAFGAVVTLLVSNLGGEDDDGESIVNNSEE